MDRLAYKRMITARRVSKVRTTIKKTANVPRLSVHISNKHVLAQVIDDNAGQTLVYISSVGRNVKGNLTDKAAWVGQQVALAAKKKKLKKVVFDRGAKKYHGRIKALADAARNEGMEF